MSYWFYFNDGPYAGRYPFDAWDLPLELGGNPPPAFVSDLHFGLYANTGEETWNDRARVSHIYHWIGYSDLEAMRGTPAANYYASLALQAVPFPQELASGTDRVAERRDVDPNPRDVRSPAVLLGLQPRNPTK